MIGRSVRIGAFVTIGVAAALVFAIWDVVEVYWQLVVYRYAEVIVIVAMVLFVDVSVLAYLMQMYAGRTGRKLERVDRNMQSGNGVLRDLSERLARE